jgi:calcineurin-like phosphoesterase family protein
MRPGRVVAWVVAAWILGAVALIPSSADTAIDPGSSGKHDTSPEATSSESFTFSVTADMREYAGPGYDSSEYFRGAVEAIAALGESTFMVSPGDIDPPDGVLWTITRTLGITHTWYPGVGNHELSNAGNETSWRSNLNWLNSYNYGAVNPGPEGCPETTYSFDYQNAHVVMLNEYCDYDGIDATQDDELTNGDIPDHLYDWLVADLSATTQPHIFVFGHEPAYPQPDADNGRLRHETDSLNEHPVHRDRFWSLLRDRGITAYICGHTHNYSAVQIDGVWQVDTGHARGLADTGARSTFLMITVSQNAVTLNVYRDDASGGAYTWMHREQLASREMAYSTYLPVLLTSKPIPPTSDGN